MVAKLAASSTKATALLAITGLGRTQCGALLPVSSSAVLMVASVLVAGTADAGTTVPARATDRVRARRRRFRRAVRVAGDALHVERLPGRPHPGAGVQLPRPGGFGAIPAQLDALIAELEAQTGFDQIDLLGHSLGTGLMQAYLADAGPCRERGALRQHRRCHCGRAARRRRDARAVGQRIVHPPHHRRAERVHPRPDPRAGRDIARVVRTRCTGSSTKAKRR